MNSRFVVTMLVGVALSTALARNANAQLPNGYGASISVEIARKLADTATAEGKKNGRPRLDDRKVLNGIFFILRTGSPWRDLPERYGPYTTVYNRFNRWAKKGVWLSIFEALSARSPQSLQLIDSSIVRAHQHAAGGK